MRWVRLHAAAAAAIIERDAVIFTSYRLRFVGQTISGLFSVALFYYVSRLVDVPAFATPDDYFAFVVVGMVVLHALVSMLSALPMALRQELVAGTFERIVLSPFGAPSALTTMAVFPLAVALAQGSITLAVATLVFGMPLEPTTAALALPVALIAALAFVPFALVLAASVLAVKQAGTGAAFFVAMLSLVGGFFFPVSLLPSWIEWTAEVQPFTPALDLLRHLLVGADLDSSPAGAILKIVVFAAVLIPISAYVLNASLRFAQRRGTVIEY
jgi:ABC-2 type transport system permease protein